MWSHKTLLEKSFLFASRAMDVEDRNSSIFPFWCALSLELIARSALAKVHSSLLADSQQNSDSVLFACGIPGIKSPKSIQTKQVFLRCNKLIENFTERDYKFSMLLMEKRNEELHTGATPFENWQHNEWLPEYYRVCQILLHYIEKELKDMFGEKEATAVEKMLKASLANKKEEAHKILNRQKETFSKLPITDRLEKIKNSQKLQPRDYKALLRGKTIDCPACEGSATIIGELIRSSNPRDEDGELVQNDLYLPEKLQCYSCGLFIEGYDYLQGIGLGETFQKKDVLDPMEYYEIDPADYYEPDYDPY
ncbi:MAG: hypothetical protein KAU38_08970 [Desulfobacterales bacterium]|nr:hypothetical protein [Desulfobacterales bacterium]